MTTSIKQLLCMFFIQVPLPSGAAAQLYKLSWNVNQSIICHDHDKATTTVLWYLMTSVDHWVALPAPHDGQRSDACMSAVLCLAFSPDLAMV